MKLRIISLIILISSQLAIGQLIPEPELSDKLISKRWPASWVRMEGSIAHEYGVYLYRNTFEMDESGDNYIIHISADNRYKLYVNDTLIGVGPAKGDIDHWFFDTYNIANYLKSGKNTIAVKVWNYGRYKPVAFIGSDIRFLCQGNGREEEILNTPGTWKVSRDQSTTAEPIDRNKIGGYIVVPPGDNFNCSMNQWGWTALDFDDSSWDKPTFAGRAFPRGVGGDIDHALVPRLIPAMKYTLTSSPEIRLIDGDSPSLKGLSIDGMEIPAGTKRTILLDQKELVNSYPLIKFSKGKDARIRIIYSEALFDDKNQKGNRNNIDGKKIKGYSDLILPDGGDNRQFSPLWFRTFRYAMLEIETGQDPLLLHAFENYKTGYPFEELGYFKSSDPGLASIWETAWRTSELCAGETYYDCPYYEQLQYVGDTRIQALISLYVSGDDRLMRKAIIDFYNSILPEGLTQSRYPSDPEQIIPTYSLFWISMLNDYLWHRPDYEFIFEFLVPMQNIITWFEKRIDPKTGMLGSIEFWPFVDWADAWNEVRGTPPDALTGNSSITTLLFAMALDQASEIFNFYGYSDIGKSYTARADELTMATRKLCWDNEKGFMADSPAKTSFSQHASALAVLTDAIPEDLHALVIDRASQSEELIAATFYFKFYLHKAMIKAGLEDKYIEQLDPWYKMIETGLTTFAEKPDPTRSDCHAWSSSPLLELLTTVAGIRPGGYGFETIIIEPHPGNLEWIKASVPHYRGEIKVDLQFSNKGDVKGTVTLPDKMTGVFIWDGRVTDIYMGEQKVRGRTIKDVFKIE